MQVTARMISAKALVPGLYFGTIAVVLRVKDYGLSDVTSNILGLLTVKILRSCNPSSSISEYGRALGSWH